MSKASSQSSGVVKNRETLTSESALDSEPPSTASTRDAAESDTDSSKQRTADPTTGGGSAKSDLPVDSKQPDDFTVSSADDDTARAAAAVKAEHNHESSCGEKESESRETSLSADGGCLAPGVRVAVRVGVERLLQLQRQCDGTTADIKTVSVDLRSKHLV